MASGLDVAGMRPPLGREEEAAKRRELRLSGRWRPRRERKPANERGGTGGNPEALASWKPGEEWLSAEGMAPRIRCCRRARGGEGWASLALRKAASRDRWQKNPHRGG